MGCPHRKAVLRGEITEKDFARFAAKVDTSGDCWRWTAATNGGGYGKFFHRGGLVYAHVFSFALYRGERPDGAPELLHSCGNGHLGCVTPWHLEPGTHAKNMAEQFEIHGTLRDRERVIDEASLSWLREMRFTYRRTYAELAREIGLPVGLVRKAIIGKGSYGRPVTC